MGDAINRPRKGVKVQTTRSSGFLEGCQRPTSLSPFIMFINDNVLLGDRLQNGSPYAIGPLTVLSVCLSVLSVTFVHCGQTVGWIKMKLGMQVGLGTGHIVLDGDQSPLPQRGGGAEPPNFQPIYVVAKWLRGSRCHLIWRKDFAQATLC